MHLVFKGSRDGFKKERLWNLCDNYPHSITFVQSEFGNIFGGYSSKPWNNNNQYTEGETFLFLIEDDEIRTFK